MLVRTSLNFTAIVRLIKGQFAYLNIATTIPLGEKPFQCLYIATYEWFWQGIKSGSVKHVLC